MLDKFKEKLDIDNVGCIRFATSRTISHDIMNYDIIIDDTYNGSFVR
jgi:hypothetical protein